MLVKKLFSLGKYKLFHWFVFIILIIVAFIGGWLCDSFFGNKTPFFHLQAIRQKGYELISPLLFYDASNINIEPIEYNPLKKQLSSFINDKISNGQITKVSLYFRDLTSWGWITISPYEKYYPASLMKVPEMISVLKYAELHPEILSKKVFYDGGFDLNQEESIKPLKQIQAGNYYTVDELLTYMIEYSDNNATELISKQISQDFFNEVFTDLEISVPPSNFSTKNFDYFTVKDYASFFRVLYNSTYLSREMSEKGLKLLLLGDFPQGIQAGVPTDIQTAQKFGETTIIDNNKIATLELHDCGIIYQPNRPYLLCIMTSGTNFLSLENTISGLSSVVYKNMIKK